MMRPPPRSTLFPSPPLFRPPIILATSAGSPGEAAKCRTLGFSGYLTKPVMGEELIEAIGRVLGGLAVGHVDTFVTRHSMGEDRRRFRVLLAEDDPINRLMILRTLEKRGHYVVAVENGMQVLETLEDESFDIILLDIQMPV